MNREPALIVGAVMAVLAVAVGFGLDVTGEQMALISAALVSIGAVFTRSQVTPDTTRSTL
jgi:hypothetical protein